MDDGSGMAEALLGLDGFRVLDVIEGPDELVVTVESMPEWWLFGLRRAGRGPRPDADRHPGLELFRAASAAGVDEAPVALYRCRPPQALLCFSFVPIGLVARDMAADANADYPDILSCLNDSSALSRSSYRQSSSSQRQATPQRCLINILANCFLDLADAASRGDRRFLGAAIAVTRDSFIQLAVMIVVPSSSGASS